MKNRRVSKYHLFQGLLSECPAIGIKIEGIANENKIKDMKALVWEDCSNICRNRDGCKNWTWFKGGDTKYRCVNIMIDGGKPEVNKNAISGSKDCHINGKYIIS